MSLADELERLQSLVDRGTLTREEFERAKSILLSADSPERNRTARAAILGVRSSLPLWWSSIHRSRYDRWLGGVCGGRAELNIAPAWFWRLLFCLSSMFAFFGVIVYVLLWIFVPNAPASGMESRAEKVW